MAKEDYLNILYFLFQISGNLTLEENIADNGGLRAAYQVCLNWKDYLGVKNETEKEMIIKTRWLLRQEVKALCRNLRFSKYETETDRLYVHGDLYNYLDGVC